MAKASLVNLYSIRLLCCLIAATLSIGSILGQAGCTFGIFQPKRARSTSSVTRHAEPSRPVVAVLGATGRTGSLVVEALRRGGMATPLALTRSGRWTPPTVPSSMSGSMEGVEVGQADVTDSNSLLKALAGVSAVVFAAAYAKGKSEPSDVDNAGLVRCAKVVRELGIGRLVVVSSAAVTRPYAPVGILLNTIGSGVLTEKLKGESEMKKILTGSQSTYTVVRPGGLSNLDPVGYTEVEFNQGDTLVGSIPRADVAAVSAVAATDPLNRGARRTFEMYTAKSRNGLLPWYSGKTKYVVRGDADCGAMLGRLRPDKDVIDVPGFSPFDFSL